MFIPCKPQPLTESADLIKFRNDTDTALRSAFCQTRIWHESEMYKWTVSTHLLSEAILVAAQRKRGVLSSALRLVDASIQGTLRNVLRFSE
jgi:hypothetical protein